MKKIALLFIVIYIAFMSFLHQTRDAFIAQEASKSLEIILDFNKALNQYVENNQKQVIYRLQQEGKLDKDFF